MSSARLIRYTGIAVFGLLSILTGGESRDAIGIRVGLPEHYPTCLILAVSTTDEV
jgi:hypothetical protein